MKKRGRPFGYKLSDESKQKISESKIGQTHDLDTKDKISASLKRYFETPKGKRDRKRNGKRMKAYFKTPEGIAQANRLKRYMRAFWSSPAGEEFKLELGDSMKDYYDDHFREQG
jgi:hypothetical protein